VSPSSDPKSPAIAVVGVVLSGTGSDGALGLKAIKDRGGLTIAQAEDGVDDTHEALRDPPFSRIDLVSCRNLMIYLGPQFQEHILPILHYALVPEGFMFLGSSEGVTQNEALFQPFNKAHRVFQSAPNTDERVTLPLLSSKGPTARHRHLLTENTSPVRNGLQRQIEAHVLHDHAPPHALVNEHGEALFHSSRTGAYLEFAVGAPSRQLLQNARRELRLILRRGLHDAAESHTRVVMPEVTLTRDNVLRRIQVSVEPFEHGEAPLYLALFNDRGAAPRLEDPDAATDRVIEVLERELHKSREQLQASYEEFENVTGELRTSNEELMSVNEELQSSNEELETSREELQSINEELTTVNAEMARHRDALARSNADLSNLLESIGVAAIFLDRRMAIRRFTRAATEIFTLIPSDTGRMITDLTHHLEEVHLRAHFARALEQKEPTELRISRGDGSRHYVMKMMPYTGVTEESGGPPVTPPTRHGFGTLLLERQLAYELHAQSDIDFAADGLIVSIHIPRPASRPTEAP